MPGIPNATADFLKVVHFFQSPSRVPMSCATYWSSSPTLAAVDDANIILIANAAHSAFGALWADLADSVCELVATRATWYGQADDGFHQGWSTAGPVEGNIEVLTASSDIGESDALPDHSALLIAKNTGSRLRERRGRLFIPCISEDANKNGYLQEELFAAANLLAAFVSSDQVFEGFTWHARHWNKKANTQHVVTQALVMRKLSHRIDRAPRGLNLPT